MSRQRSVLALGRCLACLEFMLFPVWRGIGTSNGAGWTQGWGRCLRWDSESPNRGTRFLVFDYPVWLVLCRRGRARLREVCQRGRGAIRLPTDMLSIKLPQVFEIHQIPKVFREDSIISGYRHPCSSALDCVLSSFHLNNETVNIWTHFLPTWYFVWCFCALCSKMNFLNDSYTWPLLVYMLLICIYPFTSSCAHTFSTMSPESRHICYFFDYGALSLYSLGCAISYGYYVMPECWVNSWLHQHFVLIAIGNTLFCTSMSCYSRFVELQFPKRSKVLRTGAFVVPFIFDTVPLFYRVVLWLWGSCSQSDALSSHCYHLLFAFLTCFLFTAHLPERLAPGRFDYIGHSHQLFHVCAVVGTHFQMEGVIADMTTRRAWLQTHSVMPSFLGTIGALAVSLALNLGVIAIFSAPLLWKPGHASNQQHTSACESKEQ
ncbi:progestin and adipoQ receptor family member 6 isoform X1 [Austrofundulus limnaeus]|uniref:Progestin and adipoQ receptor family member 6 isoform X1 n=1 Tax=Austrofundulus limnaeus TaxID=52670 RepID=A0A2I4CFZ0_AUSLI|nr:PREDICTED: progestin and adipoQ receptor family member 6-like isoform X1 [Austrofundulus limnaeus]